MALFSDPDVRSQLKNIGSQLLLFLSLGCGIIILFLIFLWELQRDPAARFGETGPLEITQSLLLGSSVFLYFISASRYPERRRALVLTSGFLACMFIREQDYFLDMIQHGFWFWPALSTAAVCLLYACFDLRGTISGLERLVRWKYFPFLLIGLAIVLAYSRLFGMRLLWELLLGDCFSYQAKTAMEESSELLGYLFVLSSAILINTDNKPNS